ncbi:MAG: hypothetical protein WCG25_07920 [bacterium]
MTTTSAFFISNMFSDNFVIISSSQIIFLFSINILSNKTSCF